MTAKEKAEELIDKYLGITCMVSHAKSSALICVDELIEAFRELSRQESGRVHIDFGHGYWEDVKTEIEKI